MKLTWSDPRSIGEQLYEDRPKVDPLSVSFVQLHQWICDLDSFDDDPKGSSEGHLESVQMVWYEEWKLDNE